MKISYADLKKKIVKIMTEKEGYHNAAKLAAATGTSAFRVRVAIRKLKEGTDTEPPIGIHSVVEGYILSEFASMQDDLELFRRLNGIRTSIFIAANAASPHIEKRWTNLEDKRTFELLMKPLTVHITKSILDKGREQLKIKLLEIKKIKIK